MSNKKRERDEIRSQLRYRNYVDPVATAERLEKANAEAAQTAEALRELLRAGHELVRDCREAVRAVEGQYAAIKSDLHAAMQEAVTRKVDAMHVQLNEHVEDASQKVYARFDTIGEILMGERDPDGNAPTLIQLAQMLRDKWDDKPSDHCLSCGVEHENFGHYMDVNSKKTKTAPDAGDIRVCPRCQAISIYIGEGVLTRRCSPAEYQRLAAKPEFRMVVDHAATIQNLADLVHGLRAESQSNT